MKKNLIALAVCAAFSCAISTHAMLEPIGFNFRNRSSVPQDAILLKTMQKINKGALLDIETAIHLSSLSQEMHDLIYQQARIQLLNQSDFNLAKEHNLLSRVRVLGGYHESDLCETLSIIRANGHNQIVCYGLVDPLSQQELCEKFGSKNLVFQG